MSDSPSRWMPQWDYPSVAAGELSVGRVGTIPAAWAAARTLTNPNQVTTPLGHSVPPEQTVTVVDPRHPLCGRTFILDTMTHHYQLGQCCVVWLQLNEKRLIPLQATNLAFNRDDIFPSPLSLGAVEQLLRVFHDIQHASEGVSSDANSSRPRGAATPERRPDCTS